LRLGFRGVYGWLGWGTSTPPDNGRKRFKRPCLEKGLEVFGAVLVGLNPCLKLAEMARRQKHLRRSRKMSLKGFVIRWV
jgi:hypothetical protein